METRTDHLDANDGSLIAPTPVWDRRTKRGRRTAAASMSAPAVATPAMAAVADEPRTFVEPEVTPTASSLAMDRAESSRFSDPSAVRRDIHMEHAGEMAGHEAAARPVEAEPMAAIPAYDRRRAAKAGAKGGVSTAAIVAGVAVLGGIAAGAWFMNQPRADAGANTAATQVATAAPVTAPPVAAPAAPATVTASAPAAAAPMAQPTRVARARPAQARAASAASADGVGVDASATLPAAPMPYAQIQPEAGAAAGATVKPAPVPAAAQPAVQPAPAPAAPTVQQAAPAAPQTAPVNPAPDTTTSPTP